MILSSLHGNSNVMWSRGGQSTRIIALILFFMLSFLLIAYYNIEPEPPSPSYPSDQWEFLWFKYEEDSETTWGKYLNQSYLTEWNFRFEYGTGEVAETGEYENVELRASRTLTVPSKTKYRIVLASDDGIRLFIYNPRFEEVSHITTGWTDRAYTSHSYERVFEAGEYKILLEWYEHFDNAQITFNMTIIE